jgi:hypothetical protein
MRPFTNRSNEKLDLLFMIDNSPSMGDKQLLLVTAVPDLINRLVRPNCVDSRGQILGGSDGDGQCGAGKPEFRPVHDMHIGIVTSSLGSRGGNQCPADATSEANPNLSAHKDDRGELVNRGGDTETPVPNAGSPLNFLAWYPPVPENAGGSTPVRAETSVGAPGEPGTLIGDFTSMVQGIHQHGCAFNAQNEAWYRFLVQPDPFDKIQVNNNGAGLFGIDSVILQQRKAFLRPDSLLFVIVVTDKDEEVVNPLSLGGEGWMYESAPFPGSPTYAAPEGTIECRAAPGPMSGPNDPNCTSCALSSLQTSSTFAQRCPNYPPGGTRGFLDPSDDDLNVRFFNQKQRFGVFPGYPIARYVRGLTARIVPDRAHEVDGIGNYIGDQDANATCVNPVFAKDLPTDPGADLCHLTLGPRTPDLVYYAAVAGVPHQLLQAQAAVDWECSAPQVPSGTAQKDCPQKNQFTEADWLLMTGKDPEHWDFSGADPHMVESEGPRAGLPCSPSSNDNCDPINGREWSTNKKDLQFACIFPFVDLNTGQPTPRDCTQPQYAGACDCASGSNSQSTPLCRKNGGTYSNTQIYCKAYPSLRAMQIAHAMANSRAGVQGIVSSLCPIHTSFANWNPTDPLFGFRPAMNAMVNRLKSSLSVECLPHKLNPHPDGTVDCLILVMLPKPGDESVCTSMTSAGLGPVPPAVLDNFRAAQEAVWNQNGGASSGPEPNTLPVCALTQLTKMANPDDFDMTGSCEGATKDSGWCYVDGQAAGTCPQQILFTIGEPPPGSVGFIQCSE